MHIMELDLDNPGRCNILCLRHATPTPRRLQDDSVRLLGQEYRESHFPQLSAAGAALSVNVGMRLQQQFLRGRRLTGLGSSRELRAAQTLAAVMYGARNLCSGFQAPTPMQSSHFSAWDSPNALAMARETDVRIDAERERSRNGGPLPDYEETVFAKRSELGLGRLMVDTYHEMARGVEDLTEHHSPGTYIVVGHAPNLSIFACGKFRDPGSNGLWNSLTSAQHIRVLGGISVPGQPSMFRTLQSCEGFWYVVDSRAEQHGIIPMRHSPGMHMLHSESMALQDDHRQMFIEQRLQPAMSPA